MDMDTVTVKILRGKNVDGVQRMPAIVDKSTFYVIRMINRGCTNRPFYHICVHKNRQSHFGKATDQLGAYDPMPNKNQERIVTMDFDKLGFWLNKGARPSKYVQHLLGLSGYLPINPRTRLIAHRRQKAASAKADQTNQDTESSSGSDQTEVSSS